MNYIYIGEIVNTHGLKGELKIRSDFKYKDRIFKKEFKLYINNRKEEVEINSYRPYKTFDMVTFKGHLDINEVLGYKGEKAYINKEDLILSCNEYLNEDLIGLKCYIEDLYIGKVDDIINNKATDIFVITDKDKEILVPYVSDFINEIDLCNKKIKINNIEGLI